MHNIVWHLPGEMALAPALWTGDGGAVYASPDVDYLVRPGPVPMHHPFEPLSANGIGGVHVHTLGPATVLGEPQHHRPRRVFAQAQPSGAMRSSSTHNLMG